MANALVVHKSRLPTAPQTSRAAQYVRMSTEHQRYSIENQAAVIATYARLHDLTIVATYRDAGLSGLRLKNRTGLIQLLDDVQSGRADFSHILVYDISRWGRFQDTDEAAHYEFICKKAGIKVAYCAEQFDNDGTMMSSIMKNLKRVMAAEFSRELSVKVHTGLLRVAASGFRVGAPLGYGLRRELVDENGVSKGFLTRGQQKNLKTDRVLLRLGPLNEVEVIRRIFTEYVKERKSQTDIMRRLNRDGIPNHLGRPWTKSMVDYVLSDERYMGNIVYNRESRPLREQKIKNPPELWIRTDGAVAPAISQDVFLKARRRLTLRWRHLDDHQLLERLKSLLEKEGKLSQKTINDALGVPAINVYADRFGSLRNAYRRIGYEQKRDFDWIDRRTEFNEILSATASYLIGVLNKSGLAARFEPKIDMLTIDSRFAVSLRLARCSRNANNKLLWTIRRRAVMPRGHILAIRLAERNRCVLDYVFLPTTLMRGPNIRFTEASLKRFDGHFFATPARLAKAISHELTRSVRETAVKSDRASQAMSRRPKRAQSTIRSKNETVRGRR